MATISAQGVTKPYEAAEAYGAFGDRTPALQSFRLTFGSTDRHLGLIGVLPGGPSQDLSPDADAPPVNIPDGQLRVYLQDGSPSGEEFGYYAAHAAVRIPGAKRYQLRDVGCTGDCTRPLPNSVLGGINRFNRPLLAIVGFKLNFTAGRDRHLDRIGVWFEEDALKIAFNDRSVSSSDEYAYVVDFVVIPTFGMDIASGELSDQSARGHQTVPLARPNSRATFMLRGFDLDYRTSDHHVRDIGVVRRANDVTVLHADSNRDDRFDWHVWYAFVSPRVFTAGGIRDNLRELEPPVASSEDSVEG